MKRFARAGLAAALLATLAFPALAVDTQQPLPVPSPSCTSCLCQKTWCLIHAEELYAYCSNRAQTFWEVFACENGYDANLLGCSWEYDVCTLGL